ncbi:hypothetical protein [Legionella lansingensis]|nr:hypothetical protein [Legionella lansingensis]
MDQKYFSVNEVIKYFEKKGRPIDFADIGGYVRKCIIHPVVYIDSIPAHAHETINVEQALVIGFCYLSAYWHISEDKIIALCDNLLRGQQATLCGINKEELTQIRITSWMTELRHFEGVPLEHLYPKPFSNDLAITGFMFPPKSPFYIHIGNIAISEEDLNVLDSTRSLDEVTGNKLDSQQSGSNNDKKINHVFHHASKRAAILRAASAIAYRFPSDVSSGKAILALIKSNKNFLFEQSEIPRSDRTNIDLINDYLRPLEECDFNRKDYEQSQEEKLFGSALSIIFSKEETKISNRSTATVTIAKKIFEKREIIGCTFELNVIEQLLDDSFALIS